MNPDCRRTDTVRICIFISSILYSLFRKARKSSNFTTMEKENLTMPTTKASTQCKIHEVEKTPFAIKEVSNFDDQGNETNKECSIIVGNWQVSAETFGSVEGAEAYIDSMPYELIFNGCIALIKLVTENENREKNNH